MARIPYLTLAEMDEDIRKKVEARYPNSAINILRALSASSGMALRMLDMLDALIRDSKLDGSAIELAICKIQKLNNCPYIFGRHAITGLKRGLSREQLQQLHNYRNSPVYTDFQRDVIAFAEQMTVDKQVSEPLFWKMRRVLSLEVLTDLIGLCGVYNSMSRMVNAFQIDPDPDAMEVLEWAW